LSQFFGCYFHQDWDLEAHDWEGVVRRSVAESGKSIAHSIAEKIMKLADRAESDDQLAEVVQGLGCYYCPDSRSGMRTWLRDLSAALETEAAGKCQVGNGSVAVFCDSLRFSALASCYAELYGRVRPEADIVH